MVKVIDIDKLFDEYISDYVYKNIGKVKPEEIENKIPLLYEEFGDKPLKELNDKTPNNYYKQYKGDELLSCLKEHLESDVAVSDFLCEAIADGKKNESYLVKALESEDNEEFTIYVMNMLNETGSDKCFDKYLEYVMFDYSETIKELATEHLKENAERVKDKILNHFEDAGEQAKEYMAEILSATKNDDKVFNLLLNEFINHKDKMAVYASFLVKFGDERAVPYFLAEIENEKISYADFQELRFSIEALGGEYNKSRDFSHDEMYKKIKGHQPNKKILG